MKRARVSCYNMHEKYSLIQVLTLIIVSFVVWQNLHIFLFHCIKYSITVHGKKIRTTATKDVDIKIIYVLVQRCL